MTKKNHKVQLAVNTMIHECNVLKKDSAIDPTSSRGQGVSGQTKESLVEPHD